jgi:hypothetical protein
MTDDSREGVPSFLKFEENQTIFNRLLEESTGFKQTIVPSGMAARNYVIERDLQLAMMRWAPNDLV